MAQNDTKIDVEILEALVTFCAYASHINTWIDIKKGVLLQLAPTKRALFSRRDEKTKRQIPNTMEYELMQRWADLTGRPVIFTNDGQQGKIDPS